jgi:hypothetical protein
VVLFDYVGLKLCPCIGYAFLKSLGGKGSCFLNQYLIAFCYLFTIILLFFAFFIVRCLPPGRPLNINLYRSTTIISLAIYNPVEFNIPEGKKPETTGVSTGTIKTIKIATIVSTTKTLGMHPSTQQINHLITES